MRLKIAQVMGLNTDQKAAQAVSETRDDTVFLALLELCSDDAFTKGRQALTELEDFFFEYEGTPAQKLTAASEEANNKFADSQFSLILAAISGKVLYIIARGEVQAHLKRGDKLSPLVSDTSAGQLISGFISAGDRMLFAAKSLISFLGGDLEKSVSLPVEIFEEELESKIGGSNPENEGMAALLVEAYEEEVDIPSVPQDTKVSSDLQSDQNQNQNVFAEESVSYGGMAQGKFRIKNAVIPAFLKTLKLFSKSKALIPKSGRGRLILGVALLIIVAVGVVFQYQQAKIKEKNMQFAAAMSSAGANFEAAKGLASLNPVESKAKLDLALGDISKALAVKPKSIEAQSLKKQIEDESPKILRQSQVSAFPEFLDLELIKKGFKADKMSLNSGRLLLLDPAAKTLAMVDLAKKSNEILAGESQLGDAAFASVNGGLAFVYSNDKGIIRVDSKNSKASSVAKADEEWGKIIDIYGFAGNVYLLDGGNKIWKYLPAADGYSDKRAYLGKNTSADFAGALKMQIESSIYVLKAGGEMLRFTKGDKDTFSYSGLPSGVKDPKSFFVSSDTDDLYLLDSGSSRLLILTKTGSYKGEIKGDKFASASDLVVDEAAKKVYLLEGSKIYTVDLK